MKKIETVVIKLLFNRRGCASSIINQVGSPFQVYYRFFWRCDIQSRRPLRNL